MDTLVLAFIAWIVAATGLAEPIAPRIVVVPQHELIELAFGRNSPMATNVQAIYRQDDATIFLLEGWDRENLLDKSELLHELVHHVQHLNKVQAECSAAYEREAYHLQLAWLREQGIKDPYAFMNISELFIVLVSACRD